MAQGGGLLASELLARSLLWQGKETEAEAILGAFDPDTLNEFEFARWGIARVATLQWSIGDAQAAEEVLAMLQQRITHPAVRLVVDGLQPHLRAGRAGEPVDRSGGAGRAGALRPGVPPIAVGWAVFGGTMAAGLEGAVGTTRPASRCAVTRSPTKSTACCGSCWRWPRFVP